MRLLICFLALYSFVSPAQSDDSDKVHFGLQVSTNQYRIDDPAGPTTGGSSMSLSGIALASVNHNARIMINLNKDAYTLAGTTTNIGQDVSSSGMGFSYQQMLNISPLWKPWIGAGLGYTSISYKNRFTYTTPAFQYKYLYADRTTKDIALLLNANSEFAIYPDWEIGLQAQLAKSITDKSSTLRVGLYVVY